MNSKTNFSQPTDGLDSVEEAPEILAAKLARMSNDDATRRRTQHIDWIEGLHQLSRTSVVAPGIDAILKALLDAADRVANVSVVTIRLRHPATGHLDATTCRNLHETEWRSTVSSGGIGLSRATVENQTPVMILDVQHSPQARHSAFLKEHGLNSYLGVPLMEAGQVAGVVGYYSTGEEGFQSDEIQYLTTIADVTAIAISDTKLRNQNAEQKIRLDGAHITVDKSEKAKSEFLGVMSHEFRTPLNLIMGYAGMMQEGMLGDLNQEQRSSLERIIQCSDDLLAMVISILEASTIEAGAVRVRKQNFDPNAMLDELKEACNVPAQKQLEVIWDRPSDLPNLNTDRDKLKQVLEHLIDNAIKFSESGRIVISAALETNRDRVRFTVADTGVGIAPEALPFVFDKFRQSDSSLTRMHGGVGLGLYIAKKFTDLLGGELTVESDLGQGSVFTLTLPSES